MTTRCVLHFATLATDNSACGVDIRRGGWTSVHEHVTCRRCLKLLPKRAADVRLDRLAVALWDEERRTGDGPLWPSFFSYADGAGEGMPFYEQSEGFRAFWRKHARDVIALVNETAAPSNGATDG